MKIKINFWSFISSLVCLSLFFIAVSSSEIIDFVTNLAHIHPLNIVLGMALVTFLLGLIGFAGATNWKLLIRSILTVVITFGLSSIILYIVLLANWFKFT
jgi:hypothetical protein